MRILVVGMTVLSMAWVVTSAEPAGAAPDASPTPVRKVAKLPAWRASLNVGQWIRFPNSHLSEAKWPDHPDRDPRNKGWRNGEHAKISAFAGVNLAPLTNHIVAHSSGRGCSLGNDIQAFNLMLDDPVWEFWQAPTKYDDLAMVAVNVKDPRIVNLPPDEQTQNLDRSPRPTHVGHNAAVIGDKFVRFDPGLPGEGDGGFYTTEGPRSSDRTWVWDITANLALPAEKRQWSVDPRFKNPVKDWHYAAGANLYGDGYWYLVRSDGSLRWKPGLETLEKSNIPPNNKVWQVSRDPAFAIDHKRDRALVISGNAGKFPGTDGPSGGFMPLTGGNKPGVRPIYVDDPSQPGAKNEFCRWHKKENGASMIGSRWFMTYCGDLDVYFMFKNYQLVDNDNGAFESVWQFSPLPEDENTLVVKLLWGNPKSAAPWVAERGAGQPKDVCTWKGDIPGPGYSGTYRKAVWVKDLAGIALVGQSVWFFATGTPPAR
ncbi:MAG: hypothetical protein AMXMBFR7_36660 [Planctomycetota bacterium]